MPPFFKQSHGHLTFPFLTFFKQSFQMAYRQNVPSGGSGALSMPGRQVAASSPASAVPRCIIALRASAAARCIGGWGQGG